MNTNRLTQLAVAAFAAMLLLGGTYQLGRGVSAAWSINSDADMRARHAEYSLFKERIYPDCRVAAKAEVGGTKIYTVYPPYAHPMLAAVFLPPTYEGARALFQALTVAALGALMLYGAAELSALGWQGVLLGAAIPLAFSGNWIAIAMGQFSVISVALVAAQIIFLRRDLPTLAGIAWALAMIKPQIALPFAAVFFAKKGQWRGLLAGALVLGLLSVAALLWTGVPALAFLERGVASQKLKFVVSSSYGAGVWVRAAGINPRIAMAAGLVLVAGFAAYVSRRRRQGRALEIGTAAALASVISVGAFYHLHYDNVVLCFVLLPLAGVALRTRSILPATAFALLAVIAFAPHSKIEAAGIAALWIELLAPVFAAGALLATIGPADPRKSP